MQQIKYTPLNLPRVLVERLKEIKTAYSRAYGRTVTYAEFIERSVEHLLSSEPAVKSQLEILKKGKD